jgi:hypothetical protein
MAFVFYVFVFNYQPFPPAPGCGKYSQPLCIYLKVCNLSSRSVICELNFVQTFCVPQWMLYLFVFVYNSFLNIILFLSFKAADNSKKKKKKKTLNGWRSGVFTLMFILRRSPRCCGHVATLMAGVSAVTVVDDADASFRLTHWLLVEWGCRTLDSQIVSSWRPDLIWDPLCLHSLLL